MPAPKALLTSGTARAILETALNENREIRVPFDSEGQAKNMKQQCVSVRSRWRRHTGKSYPEGDKRQYTSPWDHLELTVQGKFLIITPVNEIKITYYTEDGQVHTDTPLDYEVHKEPLAESVTDITDETKDLF